MKEIEIWKNELLDERIEMRSNFYWKICLILLGTKKYNYPWKFFSRELDLV